MWLQGEGWRDSCHCPCGEPFSCQRADTTLPVWSPFPPQDQIRIFIGLVSPAHSTLVTSWDFASANLCAMEDLGQLGGS